MHPSRDIYIDELTRLPEKNRCHLIGLPYLHYRLGSVFGQHRTFLKCVPNAAIENGSWPSLTRL